MKQHLALGLATVLGATTFGTEAPAGVIYQSSDGTIWNGGGGPAVEADQFFGVDFTITSPSEVTAVGGSIGNFGPNTGSIFAAILPLVRGTALPASAPPGKTLGEEVEATALAAVTFVPGTSMNASAPLSLELQPGNYALVFGSGAFGADGVAFFGGVIDHTRGEPRYIDSAGDNWGGGTVGDVVSCSDGTDNCLRLSVFGVGNGENLVPEPTTLGLFGVGLAGVAATRRKRRWPATVSHR